MNFIVIAFVMFLVVKAYNAYKARTAEPAAVVEPEEITLLRDIRDSLAARP